jgi:hypothetical protein
LGPGHSLAWGGGGAGVVVASDDLFGHLLLE